MRINMLIYYWYVNDKKGIMFLLKILTIHVWSQYRGRKHFCHYFSQAFRTAESLKCHIKDCFKINSKKWLRCLQKRNALDSEIMREKNVHGKFSKSF